MIFRISSFVQEHRRLTYGMLTAFVIASLVLTPLTFSFARRAGSADTGLFGLPLLADGQDPTGESVNAQVLKEAQGIPLPDPWDGAERVTILVMGLDYRDWEAAEGPARSDTMILLTIDPVAKTAGILSVPRDLWAVIPGFTPNKINTAYYFGELYNVPGGGPGLAMRTVEQTIGVPIDYYARIDFSAFIDFIDIFGGVKIDIPAPITVDPIGPAQIKNLKPGVQTLPGIIALAYARERHAPGGDFARAQRQQQIIIGIRDRILDFNLLPGLVANAPQIFAQLSSGIHTNLPLNDAIQLAVLASQIKKEDIKTGVIGEKYIVYGRSPDDLAILIPIPDKIRELRDEIFTGDTALGPLTEGTSEERMIKEAARISLQNGTSNPDIGTTTQNHLLALGANILELRNATASYSQTVVIDHTGNPYTLGFLKEWMNVANARIVHEYDLNNPFDIEIRIGNDWLSSNPFP
ncbi:MAG: LCP family protein [Chloroflexi bacterium]|nr:LCP family protein [Chloroflexota bacterium]